MAEDLAPWLARTEGSAAASWLTILLAHVDGSETVTVSAVVFNQVERA
jgi:hypothetical protein